MKYIDEFLLLTETDLSGNPAKVVEKAASALLAISFLREDRPIRVKKGNLPVFQHRIPVVGFGLIAEMNVKPHQSHFLNLKDPQERVFASGLPASLSYFYRGFGDTTLSFDTMHDVVGVGFSKSASSSVTEGGKNAIRNAWQELHEPTLAYVQQVATQLA